MKQKELYVFRRRAPNETDLASVLNTVIKRSGKEAVSKRMGVKVKKTAHWIFWTGKQACY